MLATLRTEIIGAAAILGSAWMFTPAYAAPFQNYVATGTIVATPKNGTFVFGATFSAISDVTVRFSGRSLGRNEGVVLVLGTQVFRLGTEARLGVTASPPFTRNIILNQRTLSDLADGSIDFSVRVELLNGATFRPESTNSNLTLAFEATEGPAITAETEIVRPTAAFMQRRMERIVANEPTAYRFDRRQQSEGGVVFADLSSKGRLESVDAGLRSDDTLWYGWAEAAFSDYQADTAVDGTFGQLSFGADYLVSEGVAIGLMGQFDIASETVTGDSEVSGEGWMVGPYVSAKLSQNLFFNARLALGRSNNTIDTDIYDDDSIFTGDFTTRRGLIRAELYGNKNIGKTTLTPRAEIMYMREELQDYAVTDGIETLSVEGSTSEFGRISLSTDIAVQVGSFVAYTTPKLNWSRFSDGLGGNIEETSGAIAVGIRTAAGAKWNGDISLGFDGLGQEDFSATTIRGQVSKSF